MDVPDVQRMSSAHLDRYALPREEWERLNAKTSHDHAPCALGNLHMYEESDEHSLWIAPFHDVDQSTSGVADMFPFHPFSLCQTGFLA